MAIEFLQKPGVRIFFAVVTIGIHLGGAIYFLNGGTSSHVYTLMENMHLSPEEFFVQLFTIGLFIYLVAVVGWAVGFQPFNYNKTLIGIFAVSTAMAVLLSSDQFVQSNGNGQVPPEGITAMFYQLLTQRQAILFLLLFTILFLSMAGYYLFRTIFRVEYSGSGFEIRLPGHIMYYVPIYPQISWQNTGVKVKEGEELNIELAGYVSPGGFKDLNKLQEFENKYLEWVDGGRKPEEWSKITQPLTWPYTSPEGYKEEDYSVGKQLPVIKDHPLYSRENYYKENDDLTVRGLPHNTVVGYIQSVGKAKPKVAENGQPAYHWENELHKKELISLSSSQYPIKIVAPKTGELWVVINDDDFARWDNSGMFFLKLTRNSWK